jgi:hypothetical protein
MPLKRDPKEIQRIMGMMAEMETKISEFYRQCGDFWKQEKDFWASLEKEEVSHAQFVRKMTDIFLSRPERFEESRPFNPVSISVALAGIQNNLQKLKEGQLQGLHLLFIARDMEQSLLETKWAELLKSKDMEYQNLLRTIESQTHSHKRKLEEKIEEVKSRP